MLSVKSKAFYGNNKGRLYLSGYFELGIGEPVLTRKARPARCQLHQPSSPPAAPHDRSWVADVQRGSPTAHDERNTDKLPVSDT